MSKYDNHSTAERQLDASVGFVAGNSPQLSSIDPNESSFRKRRFTIILDMIERIVAVRSKCEILDLGGEYRYWEPFLSILKPLPIRVTIVNLSMDRPPADARFSFEQGDATDLGHFADRSFDLVHSNSVIEHVGRWDEMARMAQNVRRMASSYYVQTPYFWFPIEPHYRAFAYHWIPPSWRVKLHRRRRLGFFPVASSVHEAMGFTEDSSLLDWTQFNALFPDARMIPERVFGLTKSMIATHLEP